MNVFIIGDRKNPQLISTNNFIASVVKETGHNVDLSHMENKHEKDLEDFSISYKRNVASIKKCDVLIAEATESYSGLGFLSAIALNEKKHILILFDKNSKKQPSMTLKASSNKKLEFVEYSNNNDIKKAVQGFLSRAKASLDTKFILIISPEIDRYLEWASENRRMHKAQVVRSALEDIIEKDKEYKAATKNS